MNRWTRLCVVLLLSLLAVPALGDDALRGTWTLTSVGDGEPAEDQVFTYTFTEATVRVTLTSAGLSQTWDLAYTVSDEGELTFEPGEGLGDPAPTVFTYRVEDDQLVLELVGQSAALTFTRVEAGE